MIEKTTKIFQPNTNAHEAALVTTECGTAALEIEQQGPCAITGEKVEAAIISGPGGPSRLRFS